MRTGGNSEWTTAWMVLLIIAVAWVALDHTAADILLDKITHQWDFSQIFAAVFVAFGALSLLALGLRILTWRNE